MQWASGVVRISLILGFYCILISYTVTKSGANFATMYVMKRLIPSKTSCLARHKTLKR